MSRNFYWSLESLPPHLRSQAERQLGISTAPRETSGNVTLALPKKTGELVKTKRVEAPIRVAKAPRTPNKTERAFNDEILLGKGKYEAVTFNLPGGRYTPDWLYVNPEDGDVYLIEVKGSYRLPTQGRSVFAFKSAVAAFPFFTFVFAEQVKGGHTWTVGFYRNGQCLDTKVATADELALEF